MRLQGVACRGDEDLRAFGNVLPDNAAKKLIREAGWLCDVLGEVRCDAA